MATVTITGLYSNNQKPYSIPAGANRTSQQAKATEALADKYRFSENAKSQYRAAANSKLVQVLESANGRQPAMSFNMKTISPPQAENPNFVKFKGTESLIDSRAQSALRMPVADITVGGPSGIGALEESPLLKTPKIEPKAQAQPRAAANTGLQNRAEPLEPYANRAAAFGRQTALGTQKPGAPTPKPIAIPGSGQNAPKPAYTIPGANRQAIGAPAFKAPAPKPMGLAPKAAYSAAQAKPAFKAPPAPANPAPANPAPQAAAPSAPAKPAPQPAAPVGGKINVVG